MPLEDAEIKEIPQQRGVAEPITGGIRRSNNAAGSIRTNGRKCLTCHHFGRKLLAVSTARYAAGVAIATNYEGRFPAAELHSSADGSSGNNRHENGLLVCRRREPLHHG
jgi:hypothetical protein